MKMKKVLMLLLIVGWCGIVCGQSLKEKKEGYVIHGQIDGNYKAEKVYLVEEEEIQGIQKIVDSCVVENNRYVFQGEAPEYPVVYYIKSAVDQCSGPLTTFFLEQGDIKIRTDAYYFTSARVGGTVNNLLLQYQEVLMGALEDSMRYELFLSEAIHGLQDEETELKRLRERSDYMGKKEPEVRKDLITRYSDQVFAVYAIFRWLRFLPLEEVKELRRGLSSVLNDHPYTRQLDGFIQAAEFGKGSQIPDLELPDKNGQLMHLNDFKGKYLLIDFWASWCMPCMQEMPLLADLYKKYGGKKFEIIGISLDSKKDTWLEAMKKAGMKWPQLCDFKANQTALAKACNVKAIPYTILVGPDGKVIALNLRGEQLKEKIKEVLGKK